MNGIDPYALPFHVLNSPSSNTWEKSSPIGTGQESQKNTNDFEELLTKISQNKVSEECDGGFVNVSDALFSDGGLNKTTSSPKNPSRHDGTPVNATYHITTAVPNLSGTHESSLGIRLQGNNKTNIQKPVLILGDNSYLKLINQKSSSGKMLSPDLVSSGSKSDLPSDVVLSSLASFDQAPVSSTAIPLIQLSNNLSNQTTTKAPVGTDFESSNRFSYLLEASARIFPAAISNAAPVQEQNINFTVLDQQNHFDTVKSLSLSQSLELPSKSQFTVDNFSNSSTQNASPTAGPTSPKSPLIGQDLPTNHSSSVKMRQKWEIDSSNSSTHNLLDNSLFNDNRTEAVSADSMALSDNIDGATSKLSTQITAESTKTLNSHMKNPFVGTHMPLGNLSDGSKNNGHTFVVAKQNSMTVLPLYPRYISVNTKLAMAESSPAIINYMRFASSGTTSSTNLNSVTTKSCLKSSEEPSADHLQIDDQAKLPCSGQSVTTENPTDLFVNPNVSSIVPSVSSSEQVNFNSQIKVSGSSTTFIVDTSRHSNSMLSGSLLAQENLNSSSDTENVKNTSGLFSKSPSLPRSQLNVLSVIPATSIGINSLDDLHVVPHQAFTRGSAKLGNLEFLRTFSGNQSDDIEARQFGVLHPLIFTARETGAGPSNATDEIISPQDGEPKKTNGTVGPKSQLAMSPEVAFISENLPERNNLNDQNGKVSSLDIGKPVPTENGNPVDVVTTKSVSPFQSSISSVLGELSPIEQITTFIGQQGANAATQGYLSGSNEVRRVGSVLSSGVKTLSLALEPQDLGSVTIKLRLSRNGLELNVEADRLGTARLIEKDKDRLLKGLESSGYLVDTLVVKAADNQSPTLQQGFYSDSRSLDSNSKTLEHQAAEPNFQQDNSNANDGRGSENKNGQPNSNRLGTGSGDLPPSVGNGDIYI